jgi:hypothetical protein
MDSLLLMQDGLRLPEDEVDGGFCEEEVVGGEGNSGTASVVEVDERGVDVEREDGVPEADEKSSLFSSPYSSFLLPLLSADCFSNISNNHFRQREFMYSLFYKLQPDFSVPSVADQIDGLRKENSFEMASNELAWMTKSLFPGDRKAEGEVCSELLDFVGDTSSVPFPRLLSTGFARYYTALSKSGKLPRLCAIAEVFYSTCTSEASCERVIGIVRKKIGDNKFNYSLPTLTAMLVKQSKFDASLLKLK